MLDFKILKLTWNYMLKKSQKWQKNAIIIKSSIWISKKRSVDQKIDQNGILNFLVLLFPYKKIFLYENNFSRTKSFFVRKKLFSLTETVLLNKKVR